MVTIVKKKSEVLLVLEERELSMSGRMKVCKCVGAQVYRWERPV